MSEKSAAMLVIGDEILSGKVEDTNTALVKRELRDLGVPLKGIFVIPDELETIAAWVRHIHGKFTYVFTSGGVGPTHDDKTMAAIARGLDRPLVTNKELAEDLEHLFKRGFNDAARKMADIPEGAELIRDSRLQIPVTRVEEFYILPGEPNIFRKKFLALSERFRADPFFLARIYTQAEETFLAKGLAEAESRFAVAVGSYPVYDRDDYRVQITVEAKDLAQVRAAAAFILALIPKDQLVRSEIPG